MAIYPRLASMQIPTRNPILTRMISLTSMRRLIRFQGCGLGPPNPNPRQIILTRLARLTRLDRLPRLARVDRLPILTRLRSITSLNRQAIRTRLEVTVRRTRMTRMVSLTRRNRIIRGYG